MKQVQKKELSPIPHACAYGSFAYKAYNSVPIKATRTEATNSHYLVVLDCERDLDIHDLEKRLHQGKLSFASPQRMEKYLGLQPGSVSPFGLINDTENHVHLFMDKNLKEEKSLSFHPNDNRATVVIEVDEFMRYLNAVGNSFEFIELYDK